VIDVYIPSPIVKFKYPSAKKPTPAVSKNRIFAPREAIEILKSRYINANRKLSNVRMSWIPRSCTARDPDF
jgi:hypothetical protein